MIERKSVSYTAMERAVIAHQEAQYRKRSILTRKREDKAAVAPNVFHAIKCHTVNGGATELLTPRESRTVVSKLVYHGVLDEKHQIGRMSGIDGALTSVRVGVHADKLSATQQEHIRSVLRIIRRQFGARCSGEGLVQHVDRLARELDGLNKQARKVL